MTEPGRDITTSALHDLAEKVNPACQMDPDLWFSTAPAHKARAKRACDECVMVRACREYAQQHGLQHGIWGGVDRRALTRAKVSA